MFFAIAKSVEIEVKEEMKTNRVVNLKELKTKNANEMFFSWIELYKKVFPNLKSKNIIFGGRNISSNNEIR